MTVAPFIVGAPRSGTTLRRLMLDAHPQVAIPPETGFLPVVLQQASAGGLDADRLCDLIVGFESWPDFHLSEADYRRELRALDPFDLREGLRTFYRSYASRFGKAVWGDKTPYYGSHIESIGSFFPEARFVHIIRDGRAVAASVRGLWFAPSDDLAILGEDWSCRVRAAREQGVRQPHYLEVRYEDLVGDPARILKIVFSFLDLSYDPGVLQYHERAAMRLHEHEGRKDRAGIVRLTKEQRLAQQVWAMQPLQPARCTAWREVLDRAGEQRVLSTAGPLLEELGYLSS